MGHGEPRRIRAEQLSIQPGGAISRLPIIGAVLAVIGLGISGLLYGGNHDQFYFSWLVSFLYFLSIALGGLFFVLALHVTKAGWGIVMRRIAENVMATIPILALLFIPILAGMHTLFHWTHEDAMAHDPLLQSKAWWLNSNAFVVRAVIYFLIWSVLALWYRRSSIRQDESGDESISRRLIFWSGPAIMLYGISASLAAIDWIMSLDPHWYSTIYGVYFFAGCLVGIFSFMILFAVAAQRSGYLEGVVTTEHFHDLGKLLFAFTVFWTYIGFSQYFLIWYGNIPEETAWYLHRMTGSWRNVTIGLALGHFIVPFFFLMSRNIKRRTPFLALGAIWMLLMHLIDIHWLVMPTLHKEGFAPSLLDLTTLVGIGGLFLAVFGWLSMRAKLVPVRDPRLVESLSFQNF